MDIFFHPDAALMWAVALVLLLAAVVGAAMLVGAADDLIDDTAWHLGRYHEETFN